MLNKEKAEHETEIYPKSPTKQMTDSRRFMKSKVLRGYNAIELLTKVEKDHLEDFPALQQVDISKRAGDSYWYIYWRPMAASGAIVLGDICTAQFPTQEAATHIAIMLNRAGLQWECYQGQHSTPHQLSLGCFGLKLEEWKPSL